MSLPFETDDDRLAHVQSLGEEFSVAGQAGTLWVIFRYGFVESGVGEHVVEQRAPTGKCRSVDVASFRLTKGSVLKRADGGQSFLCRHFEPGGTGMTAIVLESV